MPPSPADPEPRGELRSSGVDRTLAALRATIVDGALKILVVIGAIGLVAGVNSALGGEGWSTRSAVLVGSYVVAYAAVLVGAFTRVAPLAKRSILVGVMFMVAGLVLMQAGLLGEGRLFALAWVVLVALLVGDGAGLWAAMMSVLLVLGVGIARALAEDRLFGLFRVHPAYDDLHHWFTATAGYVLVLSAAVIPLFFLSRHLATAVATAERAEERHRRLYDQSPAIHLTLSSDLRIRRVNDVAVALLQIDREALVGRSVLDVCQPDDKPWVADHLQALFANPGRPRPWRMALVRPDASRLWVDVHGRGLVVPSGPDDEPSALLVCQDVTEQHALAEQVRQSQKMEAFGQLAGGVAHDFNNLLTPIVGHADFAMETLEPDHPARQDLAQILKAADSASALTQQILAFGRRQALKLRDLDLNASVRSFEAMAQRLFTASIEIETDLDPVPIWVHADRGALDQVLMNLCVNARDAMPDGGHLRIATWRTRGSTGPLAQLTVTDDGVGMDEATAERVFDPFFTTKPEGRGTGLGLSVVFGIVHQLDGRIQVTSTPGVGTRFEVLLPLVAGPVTEATLDAARPTSPGHETILLVDDDPAVRLVVARQLRQAGYTVRDEGDPSEVLARTDLHEVDLVITDILMPKMSGPSLHAQLVARGLGDRPVIYLSGSVSEGSTTVGAPTLSKPFTREQLLRAVEDVLDASRT